MSRQIFNRVILYARQFRANQEVAETLCQIQNYFNERSLTICQTTETYESFKLNIPIISEEKLDEHDLILVVGGDGTMLSAARLATEHNLPVIGVNRGRLGFLTDLSPQDITEELTAILCGNYIEESRFLLTMQLADNEKEIALNDIVLNRGKETHLINFDVYINKKFVNHYRADGLIIATPTGSSAYALSAGGPIMHPTLNAIAVVPMFAHTLSARPFVISADDIIEIDISKNSGSNIQISCDGNISHEVKTGNRVKVYKNLQTLRLLHPLDYHYYDTLRIKLGWGHKSEG